MATKIRTVRDAAIENRQAKADAEHDRNRRRLTAKVRHWRKRAAKYGGELNLETLRKFEEALAALGPAWNAR